MKNIYIYIVFLFFFPQVLSAQVASVEFGKNRVQFHNEFENWLQYESTNFVGFWYGTGKNIGQSAIMIAEDIYAEIEELTEHRINEKIEIIVYKDITDLNQSNIGEEELLNTFDQKTLVLGKKIFVHFNGDHQNLRSQIREGTARVFLNSLLLGNSLQEMVQASILLNLPDWVTDGLVKYIADGWTSKDDSALRELLNTDSYKDYKAFATQNPILAGKSIWFYIDSRNKKGIIPTILYLAKNDRSLDSGFYDVLGMSSTKVQKDSYAYYKELYAYEAKQTDTLEGKKIELKNKKNIPITDVLISPDGKRIAYVLNDMGRYKVILQHMEKEEKSIILRGGQRNQIQNTDYNYPKIAWNSSGQELAILFEKNDIIYLGQYDIFTDKFKQTEPITNQYQRVHSISYKNNYRMLLSATINGFSDLFIYSLVDRQTTRITNDIWDDLDAQTAELDGRKGYIFSSNRPDTLNKRKVRIDSIVPEDKMDIFFLPEDGSKLIRLTNTPNTNEREAFCFDENHFTYLSDNTGIVNRYIGEIESYIHHYEQEVFFNDGDIGYFHKDTLLENVIDSVRMTEIDSVNIIPIIEKRGKSLPQTNLRYNLDFQKVNQKTNSIISKQQSKDNSIIYLSKINTELSADPISKDFNKKDLAKTNDDVTVLKEDSFLDPDYKNEDTEETLDIDSYVFQSGFEVEEENETTDYEEGSEELDSYLTKAADLSLGKRIDPNKKYQYFPSDVIPYRLLFRNDFINTEFDNNNLLDDYYPYNGTPSLNAFQPSSEQDPRSSRMGILMKANFKDLLEDYELEAGIKFPSTFNGYEAYIRYNNNKSRLDKEYFVYKSSFRFTEDNGSLFPSQIQPRIEANSFVAQYKVSYPFSVFSAVKTGLSIRLDQRVQLATDQNTLETLSENVQRLRWRSEYVYDNTIIKGINILNGTRVKGTVELSKGMEVDLTDDTSFSFNDGFMTVFSLDARNYIPVLKKSVFASRVAAATSIGSEKVAYFIGATDNMFFSPNSDTNNDIPTPNVQDGFRYQMLMPNLRGFSSNIRNGNSYLMLNTELRVPIFQYISNNIRSPFLRNFQLVGFFDAGSAWVGKSPFATDNPLNIKNLQDIYEPGDPNVFLSVKFFRDPFVMGYGAGVRMLILGYYLRIDYAQGIETGEKLDPRLFFSLGYDF
jgi:hypothetical protein